MIQLIVQANALLALKDAFIARAGLKMIVLDAPTASISPPMDHAWNTIIPKINWSA